MIFPDINILKLLSSDYEQDENILHFWYIASESWTTSYLIPIYYLSYQNLLVGIETPCSKPKLSTLPISLISLLLYLI